MTGACLTAQAGQIIDPDGWNLANVLVRFLDEDGNEVPQNDPTVFTFESDIFDRDYIDGLSGEVRMATLIAKDLSIADPPGVKVVNNDPNTKPSQPESCIMASAVGVTCSSAFQTHKRYKVLMRPATVDAALSESVDMVFDANNLGDPVEEYRVFQKINNWTGQRLAGFELQVGFGIGTNFQKATDVPLAAPNLTVEVVQYFNDPDKRATFAHGLFGPIEPPNWADTGAFTGGFFDDQTRSGYRVVEVATDTIETEPDATTGGIFGKYEDVLPEDPASAAGMAGFGQFGPWIPTDFLPRGVFFDDDDNPNTDDILMAWWGYNAPNCSTAPAPVNTGDYCWMYGHQNYYDWIDNLADPVALGFVKDAITSNYQPVSQATFTAWGTDSRYYVDTIDDLANLNINYVVNVGTVDADWPTWDGVDSANFTIRVTPVLSANPTAAPGYIGTPHIALPNPSNVGTVDIRPRPEFVPGTDILTLAVADADLNTDANAAETVDVVVDNLTTNETETAVTLTETGNDTGVFEGGLPTATGVAGADNDGTIHAEPLETVQVTYQDANPVATLTASTLAVAGHDGTVQFTNPVIPNGNILIQVDDLDLVAGTITVNLVNQATGESEVVTLNQSPIAGQYVGSLASTDVAGSADNDGTMSVAVGDVLQVTYTDAVARDGSLNVARTDQVTVTAAAVGGGGGGCTIGKEGDVNPTMPLLLLVILGMGWLRRRASGD